MNLSHDLTVIYGRNAQGKTNLLEGLYYAAMGFSFRSRHDEELVKFGETDCAAEVTYCDRYGENRLLVKRIQEGKRTRKQAQRNGTPISPKEHYGSLNLVLFTPDDLQLVKGTLPCGDVSSIWKLPRQAGFTMKPCKITIESCSSEIVSCAIAATRKNWMKVSFLYGMKRSLEVPRSSYSNG